MGVGVKIAWDKFRKDFNKVVNKQLNEQAKTITELTASKFVELAQNKLLERATPKDSASQGMVNAIAQGIHYKTGKDGKAKIIIPAGHDNLAMFLEYGTGIMGFANPNPDAIENGGWTYDSKKRGEMPFYFRKDNAYIDINDENPSFITSTKRYRLKSTGDIRIYSYYNRRYDDWVTSHGLKATNFIYDTKLQIRDVLSRRYNTKTYRKALEKLH